MSVSFLRAPPLLRSQTLSTFVSAALKDPCAEVTCSYGSTCVQSSDGLAAKCMCPLGCDGKARETVCGSDGNDYRNECELHRYACKNQKNVRVQYPGPCGESMRVGSRIKTLTKDLCGCTCTLIRKRWAGWEPPLFLDSKSEK